MSGPRVRVLGWYNHGNSGDEAFRDVHRLIGPHVDWEWMSPAAVEREAASGATRDGGHKVVVLSAGDIVSRYYTDRLPPDVPVIVYGVGLAGPQQAEVLAALGDRLRGVWLRNECDLPLLQERGIAARATPDIVFCLHGHLPQNRLLPDKPRKRAIVVISDNMRADVLRGGDRRRFTALQFLFDELAESVSYLAKYYQVVLVPFSFDPNDFDLGAIYDLRPRMSLRDQMTILDQRLDPPTMIALFETADLVVTMKFHGAIYATLQGRPFLAISDARKLERFCAENGLPELFMPIREFNAEAFKRRLPVAEAESVRRTVAARRDALVPAARAEAGRFLASLQQSLSG